MTYPAFRVTNWPLRSNQAGAARGPFIFIRKGYEADEGLYRHELQHVIQWFCTLGLHSFLYLLRAYRLRSEASAYAVQMRYPDRNGGYLTLDLAAYRLALPQYDLGLTLEQARAHLKET